jgi:O-methyltransferase domain
MPARAEATPEHLSALLLDLNMMVLTSGRERTANQYARLLDGSGFELRQVVPITTTFSIMEAVPRASTAYP